MTTVTVHTPGPAISVQDLGRPGQIGLGLSQGGAMDRLALAEAAAVLNAPHILPAIEMAGMGGSFTVMQKTRFALTGAPMQASLEGQPLAWNSTHVMEAGQELRVGGIKAGVYGYLTFAGGIATPEILGSHASHITVGIGDVLHDGDTLAIGADPDVDATLQELPMDERFGGGTLRFMPGPQTELFTAKALAILCETTFERSAQANRQGIRLDHPTERFQSDQAASLASDFIWPGDIQLTGEGVPYVLMSECQTVGGYPRIGTILPQDLPKLAQAPMRAKLKIQFVNLQDVEKLGFTEQSQLSALRSRARPRFRDPKDISDLLSYQLISGVTRGDELEDIL